MHCKSTNETLFWGLLLILIGFLFLLNNSGILSIHDIISQYWPVLIILVGVLIILKSRQKWGEEQPPVSHLEVPLQKGDLYQSTTFGDIFLNLKNTGFNNGHVRTVFGGIHIDSNLLDLSLGEHTLNLDTTFGDIKFNSPKELPMQIIATNLAGRIKIFDQKWDGLNNHATYETDNFKRARKKLKLICNTSFGDIRIW